MSAAAASMRITLSTQIGQGNIFITQSSVRPPESWKRHSCQTRCRCCIVTSERVRQTFRLGVALWSVRDRRKLSCHGC